MRWSFSVAAATKADVATLLKAAAERELENFNKTQDALAKAEGRAFSAVTMDGLVPQLDSVCAAAAALVNQLPDATSTQFAVNVFGEVEPDHRTGELRASANVSIVHVPG